MRLSGWVVLLTILICRFPAQLHGIEPLSSVQEPLLRNTVVVEGRVLEREIRAVSDGNDLEYLFHIEPTAGSSGPAQVVVARTSTPHLLGSLIEGKQVVLVLEPLPDGSYRLIEAQLARSASLSSSTQAYPGAEPEHLVDGLMDLPGSSWAAAGSPNWAEIDLGQSRLITEVRVAPFTGSDSASYFYNEEWIVEYRDDLGELRGFSNVEKLLGAGTLSGPGIHITAGDPGSTSSLNEYKYYGFRVDPVSTRYVRYTVIAGDRDGDSNGAELELSQGFLVGTPVILDGSASDLEDGDLSTSITWSSNLDGTFGTGATVTVSTLSVGTHLITALIEDSNGAQSTSTTQVTIVESLPVKYAMTAAIAGTGSGTISSSPAGIDCGSDCSETFDQDAVVILSATADADSSFINWSGHPDCSDGQVTMSGDRSCTATFELLQPETHTLSINKAGTGNGSVTSSPAGIDCGADCSEDYDRGTSVTLTAMPEADSSFLGWSGDADCSDGSVTLDQPKACTATFEQVPSTLHELTIFKTGTGNGTVSSSPTGIDCGTDCKEEFAEDSSIMLTATPTIGSSFSGWSGHADCEDGNVTMADALTCTATFTLETRSLTVARSGTGNGSVTSSPAGISCGADCSEDYDYGTTVTLLATPETNSSFVGWSGDADCSDGSLTLDQSRACTAAFELLPPDTHSVTVTKIGTGSGRVNSTPAGIDCGEDCNEAFETGAVVTLTATPATGSSFAGWSGPVDCSDGQLTVSEDLSCTAIFTLETRSLTVTRSGTGNGSVTSSPAGISCGADCIEDYDYGTTVTLIATPEANSSFVGWSGDADCSDGSLTLDQSRACTATFELLPQTLHYLKVFKTGTGIGSVSSSPAGIDCGNDCQEVFVENTVVNLTATPAQGSAFIEWSGDPDCADGIVDITGNLRCTAVFKAIPPPNHQALSLSIDGAGTGYVVSAPSGIKCRSDCEEFFTTGTVITLDARPSANSVFVSWSGDTDCDDGRVSLRKERACVARFEPKISPILMDGFESDDASHWSKIVSQTSLSCKSQ